MRLWKKFSRRINRNTTEKLQWKNSLETFTISKSKVGFNIADVMNIILTKTLEGGFQSECAMVCTMIMPHLLHARSKCEIDASITKTLSRRLDLWIRCKFDDLLFEAKALQERLKKLNEKRGLDEFKVFDKQMESGKISNALRCLSDDGNGGVLSTSNKSDYQRKKLHRTRTSTRKASM